jgi:hypothetical protein
VVARVGDDHAAVGLYRQPLRTVKLRLRRRPAVAGGACGARPGKRDERPVRRQTQDAIVLDDHECAAVRRRGHGDHARLRPSHRGDQALRRDPPEPAVVDHEQRAVDRGGDAMRGQPRGDGRSAVTVRAVRAASGQGGDRAVGRHPPHAVVHLVGDVDASVRPDGQPGRGGDGGVRRRQPVAACQAGRWEPREHAGERLAPAAGQAHDAALVIGHQRCPIGLQRHGVGRLCLQRAEGAARRYDPHAVVESVREPEVASRVDRHVVDLGELPVRRQLPAAMATAGERVDRPGCAGRRR